MRTRRRPPRPACQDLRRTRLPFPQCCPTIKTIPVALSDFYTYERELEWSNAAAAITVSLLPGAALALFGHRILERFSLSPGAEKL